MEVEVNLKCVQRVCNRRISPDKSLGVTVRIKASELDFVDKNYLLQIAPPPPPPPRPDWIPLSVNELLQALFQPFRSQRERCLIRWL